MIPAPEVISINISSGGIPKKFVRSIKVTMEGLEGDGHNHAKHQTPLQAICLQDVEKLEELSAEGYSLAPGVTGENLTVRHLNVNALAIGTLLKFSNGVIIELTKVRNPCYVLDVIHPKLKEDIVGRCGMYSKVLQEGIIKIGETIQIISPSLFS